MLKMLFNNGLLVRNKRKENNMKKVIMMAVAVAAMLSLSACMGVRGHDGSGRVCENQTFLGISIIEIFSPCSR